MIVLALDTALGACSLAIMRGPERVFDKFFLMDRGHAEAIAPLAAEAFAATGVAPRDLDRIGVVTGPGTFVGVRVGVAFARGLAVGRTLAVVGVDSLAAFDATARRAGETGPAAVAIDARRGEIYAALFDDAGAALVAPFASRPDAAAARLSAAVRAAGLGPARLTGPGARLIDPVPDALSAPANVTAAISATAVAEAAARARPPFAAAPVYLRAPDAKPAAPSPFEGLL